MESSVSNKIGHMNEGTAVITQKASNYGIGGGGVDGIASSLDRGAISTASPFR